jgi:hypothetical protein
MYTQDQTCTKLVLSFTDKYLETSVGELIGQGSAPPLPDVGPAVDVELPEYEKNIYIPLLTGQ